MHVKKMLICRLWLKKKKSNYNLNINRKNMINWIIKSQVTGLPTIACGPLPRCKTSYRKPDGKVRCVTALSEAFGSFFGAAATGVAAFGAGVAALGVGAAVALGAVLGLAGRGTGVSAGASMRGFLLGGSAKSSSYISSFKTKPLSNNSPPSQLKVVSGERLAKRIGQKGRVVETLPKARRFSPTETYKRLAAAPESRKEQPCSSKPHFWQKLFIAGTES